jgi:hypothetical protein
VLGSICARFFFEEDQLAAKDSYTVPAAFMKDIKMLCLGSVSRNREAGECRVITSWTKPPMEQIYSIKADFPGRGPHALVRHLGILRQSSIARKSKSGNVWSLSASEGFNGGPKLDKFGIRLAVGRLAACSLVECSARLSHSCRGGRHSA